MSNQSQAAPHSEGSRRLHHTGFVLGSIEKNVASYISFLGATWDENIIFDPLQKVRVTFLKGAHPCDNLIELIEPAGDDSPVSRFLERGGGLHHLCYEVADLESEIALCKSTGAILVHPPVPAVAFDGRRIAWTRTKPALRPGLLVELLESTKASS